jgi:hypothetical protein
MVPSGSVDPEPFNVTLRGPTPVVGAADITAVGGWLLPGVTTVAMFEYAEYPPELKARIR